MQELARATRQIDSLRSRLLDWYQRNRRTLPWRASRDPYAIWVSEIMLQQTRVAVVVDRYKAFLSSFPTLVALALASEEQVLALWSGLGYYRRARMLHKAAEFVATNYQGNLPVTAAELRKLPGIGSYTAAAIASIAHGEPVAVIDGNVERVICRLEGWEAVGRTRAGDFRRRIEAQAALLLHPGQPGEFNQAMMELGAMVCTPRSPLCGACPVAAFCATQGEHKTAPRPRMTSSEQGYALSVRTGSSGERVQTIAKGKAHEKAASRSGREVLLERRSATETVMPGMWELPRLLDAAVPDEDLRMTVRHAIMQVNYYVRIRTVFEDDVPVLAVEAGERRWVPLEVAASMALTGLARKVLSRARLLPAPPVDALAPRPDNDSL